MAGITTHVLDTAKGRPAQGVRVTLSILNQASGLGPRASDPPPSAARGPGPEAWGRDDWKQIARGVTDADGRLRTLTESIELQRATYRLTFETAEYGNAFFPEVSIVFKVDDPGTHYHVPLLLSPFGYTTYRGS